MGCHPARVVTADYALVSRREPRRTHNPTPTSHIAPGAGIGSPLFNATIAMNSVRVGRCRDPRDERQRLCPRGATPKSPSRCTAMGPPTPL